MSDDGDSSSVAVGLNVMLGALFAVLFIVFLASVFNNLKPNEQIAFGSVEKIRSALEQACFEGKTQTIEVKDFGLPQSKPNFLMQAASRINRLGDPDILVYYEDFPIGEAIAWESYLHDDMPPTRVFAQIDKGDSFTMQDLEAFKDEVRTTLVLKSDSLKKYDLDNYEIIVNNIVLTDELDLVSLLPIERGGAFRPAPGFGEVSVQGDFLLYEMTAPFNKTLPKYFSCGTDSLCVKTNSAVYTFPLRQCSSLALDYIELKAFSDDKDESNFYFNSPCDIDKVKIEVQDNWQCSCDNFVEYPIYQYKDGKFVKVKDSHKFCIDGLDHSDLHEKSARPSKCVTVRIESVKGDGCYTLNPAFNIISDLPTTITDFIPPPTPVKDHTKAVAKNIFITETVKTSDSVIKSITDKTKGLVIRIWQWPWSK